MLIGSLFDRAYSSNFASFGEAWDTSNLIAKRLILLSGVELRLIPIVDTETLLLVNSGLATPPGSADYLESRPEEKCRVFAIEFRVAVN